MNEVGDYDEKDPQLAIYLKPTSMIQSDNPEIINTAKEIIGTETNPYKKIQLIIDYLHKNMKSGGEKEDALSVIRSKKIAGCGSAAHIFVALSKAVGVPARVVSGVHSLRTGTFDWVEENFGTHMWAEFYLPTYGWIPVDPLWPDGTIIARSEGNRIILSRDSDINLGNRGKVIPWFHMPYVNNQQEEGSSLILTVDYLGKE